MGYSMTIYQRMAAVFTAAKVPGFLQEWRATGEYPTIPEKYCTYLVEQDGEAMAADDEELVHESRVWIDVYGMTDVSAELGAVIGALREGGFLVSPTRDLDNVRLSRFQYHRRLRAIYYDYDI